MSAGVSMVRPRALLRSNWSCAPTTTRRVLARAAGGRVGGGYLAAAAERQVVRSARRARLAEYRHRPPGSQPRSRSPPRSCWAASRAPCSHSDAERSARRHAGHPRRLVSAAGIGTRTCRSSSCATSTWMLSRVDALRSRRACRRGCPRVLGGRLRVSGRPQGAGRIVDGLQWSASRARAAMSFPGWRDLLPEYLARLDAGTGAFQALARGRGATLERADLEFGAQGVVDQALPTAPNAVMDRGERRRSLSRIPAIAGPRWAGGCAHSAAAAAIPNAEFDVSWRENDAGMLELARGGELSARRGAAAAGRADAAEGHSRAAARARPHGRVDRICASRWRAPPRARPWRFDARAKFRGVGFAPVGHAPGLRGLSGSLAGSEAAGHVIIDTAIRGFNWPDQFPRADRAAGAQVDALLEAQRAGGVAWRPRISSCVRTRCERARQDRVVAAEPTAARPCSRWRVSSTTATRRCARCTFLTSCCRRLRCNGSIVRSSRATSRTPTAVFDGSGAAVSIPRRRRDCS